MTVPVITPLPPAPTRADAPSDFTAKADAFVAAQVGMVAEFNASAEFVDQRAIDADASAIASAESATASQAARAAAETARDQAQTARGEAVSANTGAQSAKTAAQTAKTAAETARAQAEAARDGAVDARNDAEYWAGQAQETVTNGIIDDTSLLATRVRSALDTSRGHFAAVPVAADATVGILDFAQIMAEGESVTVTLPASPEAGQLVMVGNFTDRRDHRIAVGSAPVKGRDVGGYVLLDKARFTLTLKFISAEYGWEIM